MEEFFWAFWWLIFPLAGFGFAAAGMWMNHRRHRDMMDLMKTYAAQGKDPAEVAKALGLGSPGPFAGGPNPDSLGSPPPGAEAQGVYGYGYGYGPRWGGYWAGPWRGRWGRYGPFRYWRRCIILGCLAIGFGAAHYYGGHGDPGRGLGLVAIILGALAIGY